MLVNMAKRRLTFLKKCWVELQRILFMSWSGEY